MCGMFLHISTKRFSFISRSFSSVSQRISALDTLSFLRLPSDVDYKSCNRPLKVSGSCSIARDDRHLRLVRSCIEDLLADDQQKSKIVVPKHAKLCDPVRSGIKKPLSSSSYVLLKTVRLSLSDSLSLLFEIHNCGIGLDEDVVSAALSSCRKSQDLSMGKQLHALSIKCGLSDSIAVGSAMISLYSKCWRLEFAQQVFWRMPEHNTISWTAAIAAHAQHSHIGLCLSLFVSMQHSSVWPNDFTFTCVLSTCTSTAALALGRSFHCLEIVMGFESNTHVSNALISMYAKCGSIRESFSIFENLQHKDLISWNSMIFGCAQYGLAGQSAGLLEKMRKEGVTPDSKTFLGILSACRHAGLLEQAFRCFNLLRDQGITPEVDHYACLVDLLGRAGLLEGALHFIESMPVPPNGVIWGSLLSACRVRGNIWIGIRAAEGRISLEPGCAVTYVQLGNLYAAAGRWDQAARVRKLMKEKGLKSSPGFSWVEIGNVVHRFRVEDGSSAQVEEALQVLDCLAEHMGMLCYPSEEESLGLKVDCSAES